MTISSAVVGQEIFLRNAFLSLGLSGSGTLGTKANAPSGFATDAANGYVRLGMVADPDGFGEGAPQTRDIMLAGTAIETFALGYSVNDARKVLVNSERDGKKDIAGRADDLSTVIAVAAGWSGVTSHGVRVEQVVSLGEDARFVRVDVKLTNENSAPVSDVRYLRSIDADHGKVFSTINTVVEQGGGKGALVAAYAAKGERPFFFYSADPRARVSVQKSVEFRDPYAASAYDAMQPKGYSIEGDFSVNLVFSLGSLGPYASADLTYYMGVADDLAATVASIDVAAPVEPAPPPPEPPPAPPPAPVTEIVSGKNLSGSGKKTVKLTTASVIAALNAANPDLVPPLKKNDTLTLKEERGGQFIYTR